MHVVIRKFAVIAAFTLSSAIGLCGCEQKEKIVDIEGPRGKVEIERSTETGKIDIEIKRKVGEQ